MRGLLLERSGKPGDFTAEDVLRWTPLAHSPAIGGVVAQLAAEGAIVKVGLRQSEQGSRRGGTVAVWLGRAFVGPEQIELEPATVPRGM